MKVSIVSPEENVFTGEGTLVIARSPEGDFGIMRGHIPFLAALVPGFVTVVSGADRKKFFVTGGFLEASGPADDYHVIVLADDAELAGDMTAEEAKARIEEARRRVDSGDREDDAQVMASMADITPGGN